MAFDPKGYKPAEAKSLPVILLLDVSGSMYGDKIEALYDAVVQMVNTFVAERNKETLIKASIITFGANVGLQAPCTATVPYVDVVDLHKNGIVPFDADGMTPLGCALRMAKDLIEDKNFTPGKWYAPAIVLVSDGQPNDEWRKPLDEFISNGRSSRCQRLAVAIGNDADRVVLKKFTGDENLVFFAEFASDIAAAFKKVTLSVSQRASQKNPDAVLPKIGGNFDTSTVPVVGSNAGVRPSVPRGSLGPKHTAPRPSVQRPKVTKPPVDEDEF